MVKAVDNAKRWVALPLAVLVMTSLSGCAAKTDSTVIAETIEAESSDAPVPDLAEVEDTEEEQGVEEFSSAPRDQVRYFSDVVNTGLDNGYSGSASIGIKDPHYGWDLGRFAVSGYSATTKADGSDVFLTNAGDTILLSFTLDQDIENLNGVEGLVISEDKNGYDEHFQTQKTNFGHGALLVKHSDYRNVDAEPTIYTDYLTGKIKGADTEIQLLEEGDYEVVLNYEIASPSRIPFKKTYSNYRMSFNFGVRNGNAMVFPFDVETGSELPGDSITENGFYLDLAMSRYLNITITKKVLPDRADQLSDDARFNRPVKDGEEFTDEGLYEITVENQYTNAVTSKKIAVGTNRVLNAHVRTGLPIREINKHVEQGAYLTDDGFIFPASIQSEEE